jgi:uncharacterized protein (DUF302 family)
MPAQQPPDTPSHDNADQTTPGLVTLPSPHSAAETVLRLESVLMQKGIQLFARIDHAAGAQAAGLALRPTVLLVFGDARAGTPLMQSDQTIGIDLPLKTLVWQDEKGQVWVSYNRPTWLAMRHGVHNCDATVKAMTGGLEALVSVATAQ